ncbi:putative colanic acid biosynthesis acetyltransferase [Rhodopirellula sp. MGV]|nr:putative colanic acid biosynthesis acetyltransferase [Rhodopirellula sp. MGV]PNY35608.1 putative colanic acid biosynthesis acetyltransferase [Rhodopirellula baltica]
MLDASKSKPAEGGASFSLRNRLLRVLWNFVWAVFASWTPPPLHRYRVALLRLFGADVDWSAHVYGSARVWLPANLQMGPHSCLGPQVNCYCMGPIRLAAGAIVSQETTLCAGTHDPNDPDFQLIAKPIVIGEKAWVAAEVFVGPGVTIAERSVVGARCVLFKNTEPDGIYVGNPAKLVGHRKLRETTS